MIFSTLKNKAKDFLGQYEQKDPATFAAAQQAIGGLLILDGFVGIDNPFQGKKRSGIFGTLIGVAVGIVFMVVPGFFGGITGTNAMTATTDAVVVAVVPEASSSSSSGGGACTLTVRYSVAGKEYSQPSSMGSSDNCKLTAGQTVPINYNPRQPGAWAYNLKSTGTYLSLFFWAGLLVAITSFVTFIIRLLSIIFGWKLLRSGRALAKTLPQGVSLGTLINEIKQNFKGTLFQGGAVSAPSMQPAQTQAQATTVAPVAVPSPVQASVQQTPVEPIATTPQLIASNDIPSMQSQQEVIPVAPSAPLDSYTPDMGEVEPSTAPIVQPQPAVQVSDPSPVSPTQPPLP